MPRHFDQVTASLPFGNGTFCVGKLDDQLVQLDLDPNDVVVDEGCVLDVGRFVEVTSNTFYDESLDLVCWDPADSSGLFRLALQKGGRDVVPVLDASLSDMARCHLMTAIVVDAAQWECLRLTIYLPLITFDRI